MEISKWKQFITYVKMCSSINATYSGFCSLSVEAIVQNLSSVGSQSIILNFFVSAHGEGNHKPGGEYFGSIGLFGRAEI